MRRRSSGGRQNNHIVNFNQEENKNNQRKDDQQQGAGGPIPQAPPFQRQPKVDSPQIQPGVLNTIQRKHQPKVQQPSFQQPQAFSLPQKQSFGNKQFNLEKSVGIASNPHYRGPNTKAAQEDYGINTQLPDLDDITTNTNTRRRQVDYNQHYGTTEAISNPIKDRLKRAKLRDKKGSGLLGTVDNTSGNSILDSYRDLGRKLLK